MAGAQRSPARLALLITIGLALVVGGAAYVVGTQSNTFVLLPDRPHPADAIVSVKGEDPRSTNDGPGIYYLDVLVHRATIGETWLLHLEPDAETAPANAIVPKSGNQHDVNRLARLDVQGSKRLAALVALRALGRKVKVSGGGVRVDEVASAPARAAGLAAGMVVSSVDGRRVLSIKALQKALAGRKVGASGHAQRARRLEAPVDRHAARLGRRRAGKTRAVLGIYGEDVVPNVKLPFPVRIDTGDLGGPSAGLAFTLEIYDSLTGRRLSRGRRVAVTGTIDASGNVGEIGGARGKTIGARRAGFDLMIVPIANLAEARANAGPPAEGRRRAHVRRCARRVAEVAARCGGRRRRGVNPAAVAGRLGSPDTRRPTSTHPCRAIPA